MYLKLERLNYKYRIPYQPCSENWMKFEIDKPAYVCCIIGQREVWAFYSHHVCYVRLSMTIKGRKMRNFMTCHWIIQLYKTKVFVHKL